MITIKIWGTLRRICRCRYSADGPSQWMLPRDEAKHLAEYLLHASENPTMMLPQSPLQSDLLKDLSHKTLHPHCHLWHGHLPAYKYVAVPGFNDGTVNKGTHKNQVRPCGQMAGIAVPSNPVSCASEVSYMTHLLAGQKLMAKLTHVGVDMLHG